MTLRPSACPAKARAPLAPSLSVSLSLAPLLALVLALVLWPGAPVRAAEGDVLGECMALSGLDDDVHACMDNYLDVMDDNIRDITTFIRYELAGAPLIAFERAQGAFETYRRENCLWYLAFSTPRRQAELIAKDCLARMSLERLAELQALLARGESRGRTVDGFYVFGENRNSFRPCGSEQRYWVDGDGAAVATLQQYYLERTTAALQVMFASVVGVPDPNAFAPAGHDGLMRLASVVDLRVPSDADCRLPSGSPPVSPVTAAAAADAPSVEERVADAAPAVAAEDVARLPSLPATRINPVADPDGQAAFDPLALALAERAAAATAAATAPAASAPTAAALAAQEPAPQQLTAYFGAWLADCNAVDGTPACRLAVDFDGGGAVPTLALRRIDGGATEVVLELPSGTADSIGDLSWRIDGYTVGTIAGSELRIGGDGLEQRVTERRTVEQDLLPLLRDGTTLFIETRDDGERRSATLIGLTRALGFADEFLGAAAGERGG